MNQKKSNFIFQAILSCLFLLNVSVCVCLCWDFCRNLRGQRMRLSKIAFQTDEVHTTTQAFPGS